MKKKPCHVYPNYVRMELDRGPDGQESREAEKLIYPSFSLGPVRESLLVFQKEKDLPVFCVQSQTSSLMHRSYPSISSLSYKKFSYFISIDLS
jgi:hypothetical protein